MSPSLSLPGDADAQDQLHPSEEEEAMLGHLCMSVCVQACTGLRQCVRVCVCVVLRDGSISQRTE